MANNGQPTKQRFIAVGQMEFSQKPLCLAKSTGEVEGAVWLLQMENANNEWNYQNYTELYTCSGRHDVTRIGQQHIANTLQYICRALNYSTQKFPTYILNTTTYT